MRRALPVLLICLCCAIPGLAQRGGHGGMRGGGMRGGSFGGFRGSGFSRGFSGFPGGFNHGRFFGGQFGFRRFPRTSIYPAFYGGFGYADPYFYNSYPNYASYPSAGYSAAGYSAPPVVISQNYYYGSPAAEEYRPCTSSTSAST